MADRIRHLLDSSAMTPLPEPRIDGMTSTLPLDWEEMRREAEEVSANYMKDYFESVLSHPYNFTSGNA